MKIKNNIQHYACHWGRFEVWTLELLGNAESFSKRNTRCFIYLLHGTAAWPQTGLDGTWTGWQCS